MFWSNLMNGMSGFNIFVAYYYAMHNVLNTIFLPIFTRITDNDVAYDANCKVSSLRISNEQKKQAAHNTISLNTLKVGQKERFVLVRWFNLMFKTEEHVKHLGYEINPDGVTTNNVAAYFSHARDDLVRKSHYYLWFNFFRAFAVGAWVYYLCAYGNEGVLN